MRGIEYCIKVGNSFTLVFGTSADGVVVSVRTLGEVVVGYHVAGRTSWRETGYSRTSSFLD